MPKNLTNFIWFLSEENTEDYDEEASLLDGFMAGFEDSEDDVTAAASENAVGQAVVATAAFVSAVDLETTVVNSAVSDFSKDIVKEPKTTSDLSSAPWGRKAAVASAAVAVVAATAALFIFKVYSN